MRRTYHTSWGQVYPVLHHNCPQRNALQITESHFGFFSGKQIKETKANHFTSTVEMYLFDLWINGRMWASWSVDGTFGEWSSVLSTHCTMRSQSRQWSSICPTKDKGPSAVPRMMAPSSLCSSLRQCATNVLKSVICFGTEAKMPTIFKAYASDNCSAHALQ